MFLIVNYSLEVFCFVLSYVISRDWLIFWEYRRIKEFLLKYHWYVLLSTRILAWVWASAVFAMVFCMGVWKLWQWINFRRVITCLTRLSLVWYSWFPRTPNCSSTPQCSCIERRKLMSSMHSLCYRLILYSFVTVLFEAIAQRIVGHFNGCDALVLF